MHARTFDFAAVRAAMQRYFEDAATFLVNRAEGDPERLPLRGVSAN